MRKKVYLVGIDQMILPLTKILLKRGEFPNLQRLFAEGSALQAISSYPAWTPTNWTTIATGAESGTHGVFWWLVDTPDNKVVSPFHSYAVKAQTIWEAAEKQGLRCAIVHYPASMPSRLSSSFVLDGDASPGYGESRYELTPSQIYTTKDIPGAQRIEVKLATGWQNLPPSSLPPLESVMKIIPKFKGEDKDFTLLFTASTTKNQYDTVYLCQDRNALSKLASSKIGQWSEWVFQKFSVEGKDMTGTFRLKLIEASKDKQVRVYRCQVMPFEGWTSPEKIGGEIVKKIGPYIEHASDMPYIIGATDLETCMEEADYQAKWLAEAARYLMEEKGCQIFYCHWHFLDYINHHHLAQVDPTWKYYNPATAEQHWKVIERAYKIIDEMVGRFFKLLDDESYLILTSDHGALPVSRFVFMERFLKQEGYLKFKANSKVISPFDENWDSDIDWENTKVYLKKGRYLDFSIYVNPRMKDKQRIVDELLVKLRKWVDEDTGKTPIALALRKEDAPLIGCWGNDIGDIICITEQGYAQPYDYGESTLGSEPIEDAKGVHSASHGLQNLTAQTGVCSHLAMTVVVGPRVKKGFSIPEEQMGYIRLKDIVPTICHFLGIQPPQHCQGAVIYSIIEGNELPMQRSTTGIEQRQRDPRVWAQETMYDFSHVENELDLRDQGDS